MKTVGQGEFGMDRRTTATLRRGVLQIGIAAGSHSYRHVLLTVLGQYLPQSGSQQNLTGFRLNLGELSFQCRDDIGGIEFPDHQAIPRQPVSPWISSGDHAGDIDPGDRGINGMMVSEGDTLGGQRRQIRHQLRNNLSRLKPVKYSDKDRCHGLLHLWSVDFGSSREPDPET